jgi:uncharacterized protein YxeA
MKRKIQPNFKSYQKILLLILILLATLLFGFINSYYNVVEGNTDFLAQGKPIDKNDVERKQKAAAKERSKNDFNLIGKEKEYLDYADTIESEE